LVVFKYDFYDPNTKVVGQQINSSNKFGLGDVRYQTFGYGVNYLVNQNVKVMAYYDNVVNEKVGIAGYGNDKNDNIFTLRVQYKF